MTIPINCSIAPTPEKTLNCALAEASDAASRYFGRPLVIYTIINYVMGYVVMPLLSDFVLPIILKKLMGVALQPIVLPVTPADTTAVMIRANTEPVPEPDPSFFLVGLQNLLLRYRPAASAPRVAVAGSPAISTSLSEKELIDRATLIVGLIATFWNYVQQGLCSSGR